MSLSTSLNWLNGLGFEVQTNQHFQFMDAKKEYNGKDRGPNPKEYVLAGLCGCTGMDVVSLLKKYKVDFRDFNVSASTDLTKNHPIQFEKIQLSFKVYGENLDVELINKAVNLSMTKYCGVSAMLSKAVPIYYSLYLNDSEIGKGQAQF